MPGCYRMPQGFKFEPGEYVKVSTQGVGKVVSDDGPLVRVHLFDINETIACSRVLVKPFARVIDGDLTKQPLRLVEG